MYSSSLLSILGFALVAVALARCGETGRRFGVGRELKQGSNGCVVENGVDYVNDTPLNDGYSTIVSSPEECCDICINFPGCERWVMILIDTKYHRKGECWLKDTNVKKTDCIVCAGGVNPKPVEPFIRSRIGAVDEGTDEGCLELPGVDFNGGDINQNGIQTASDDECCSLCHQTSGCKLWTRTKAGECWLKNVQTLISICKKCSGSGIIESRQTKQDLSSLKSVLQLVSNNPQTDSGLKTAIDNFLGRVENIGG